MSPRLMDLSVGNVNRSIPCSSLINCSLRTLSILACCDPALPPISVGVYIQAARTNRDFFRLPIDILATIDASKQVYGQ